MKIGDLVIPANPKGDLVYCSADPSEGGKNLVIWKIDKPAVVLTPQKQFEEEQSWTKILLPDGRIGWHPVSNLKKIG